mgnify:CR=1 FL=1
MDRQAPDRRRRERIHNPKVRTGRLIEAGPMAEAAVGAEPVEVEPTAGARTRGSPASTGPEARPPCHDDPASTAHPRISTVLACRGAHREEVASGHVEEPEAPTPQGERAEGDDERAEGPDLADRDPNRSADDLGPCGSAQRPVRALRSTFPDVSGESGDDSRSTPLHYATPAPTRPSGRRLRGGAPPGAPPEGPGPSVWRTGRGGGRLIPAQEARGGPPALP